MVRPKHTEFLKKVIVVYLKTLSWHELKFDLYAAEFSSHTRLSLIKIMIPDISDGTATRLRDGRLIKRGSIPTEAGVFSLHCSSRVWGPPSLLFNEHRRPLSREQSGRSV
jgi:hypothetical protein